MNDKEFADRIHLEIHAARLLPNYNPTELEKRIGKAVVDKFSATCADCKEREEKQKTEPAGEQSFFKKIFG